MRLWTEGTREDPNGDAVWRGLVEHVQTGERRTCADVRETFRYIQRKLDLEGGNP